MYLIKDKSKTTDDSRLNDCLYIQDLRNPGKIVTPDQVRIGEYFVYKEKFGIVAIVKVLKNISENEWIGFRLKIKRVLYTPWDVKKGTIFEAGYPSKFTYPTSWHLEPCISLVKCGKSDKADGEYKKESAIQ